MIVLCVYMLSVHYNIPPFHKDFTKKLFFFFQSVGISAFIEKFWGLLFNAYNMLNNII